MEHLPCEFLPKLNAEFNLSSMVFAFGAYRLDTIVLELHGPDGVVSLEPKCFALLRLLIEHRARAVSKDEIFDAIWPGLFVTEASLSTAIRQVRAAVGDSGERQEVIKTLRGFGFRFIADATEISPASVAPAAMSEPTPYVEPHLRPGKPTLAIRPFQLLGADPSQIAIAEAIPSELIATLSRMRWLNIIARGSSFRFSAQGDDPKDMSALLGARYLVSGVVEVMGRQVAVSTELADAQSTQVIWSDRKVGALDDIYSLRANVASDVVQALEIRVPNHEAGLLAYRTSENMDAWGHYHLGIRHMYRANREDNHLAAAHFEQALQLDPLFARAKSGLSYTEFQNAFQHFEADPQHHKQLSMQHAEQAMQMDELDPFCLMIYGRAKWLVGEPRDALDWVNRAIALNPNYAFGHYNSGVLNTVLCNGQTADDSVSKAMLLSPMDPVLQSMLGTRALAAFVEDDIDSSVKHASQALNAPNPHLYVFMIAAAVFSRAGETGRAQQCVARIRDMKVKFGKSEFMEHYNLQDPKKRTMLVQTIDQLGI